MSRLRLILNGLFNWFRVSVQSSCVNVAPVYGQGTPIPLSQVSKEVVSDVGSTHAHGAHAVATMYICFSDYPSNSDFRRNTNTEYGITQLDTFDIIRIVIYRMSTNQRWCLTVCY